MNKSQIIKDLIPGALLSYEKYNSLTSLTIAQSILKQAGYNMLKVIISSGSNGQMVADMISRT